MLMNWKRLSIVKMSTLPKLIYIFNTIPIKSQHNFLQTLIFQFYMEKQRKQNTQMLGRTKLEDSHYLISRFTIKLQYQRKDKYRDQWKRKSRNRPTHRESIDFWLRYKGNSINIHMPKNKPQSLSHILLKINSKWISCCQGLRV